MTLEELVTPLTKDQAEAAIYSAIEARGAKTSAWKQLGVVRTIITGVAIVLSALSTLQSLIAKSGFLEFAEGDWLTLVARYVYGVERSVGTFATGSVTLANSTGNVYELDPGDLVVLNPTTNKAYRNVGLVSIGSMATGVIVPIEAIEIGSASTSAGGEITAFVTPLLGVTCTNASPVIGTDQQTDPELRTACNEKLGTLSPNGPRDVYAFIAKSARRASGALIGVTRTLSVPDGIGGLDVYLASATGEIDGDPDDTDTDLGVIQEAFWKQCAPQCVTPRASSADPVEIDVTYELWILDSLGMSNTQIEDAIEARLLSWITTQPIGGIVIAPAAGKIYASAIEAVIGGALSGVVRVELTLPSTNVDIDVHEVPVLGTVTATAIHQIASAGV